MQFTGLPHCGDAEESIAESGPIGDCRGTIDSGHLSTLGPANTGVPVPALGPANTGVPVPALGPANTGVPVPALGPANTGVPVSTLGPANIGGPFRPANTGGSVLCDWLMMESSKVVGTMGSSTIIGIGEGIERIGVRSGHSSSGRPMGVVCDRGGDGDVVGKENGLFLMDWGLGEPMALS